ncbi:energy transducer TonB [Erythrobacter litoralis]|uniref:energy transducer TonB n=2 Tax=Erythrobacter litoralis TaxID=39960 RepID=UPI0012379BF6|nr:TonB family protein [Erythrobacter litoralis]
MNGVAMVRNAIASTVAIALALTSQTLRADEQPKVAVVPSTNQLSMKLSPQVSGEFALFWQNAAVTCANGAVEAVEWVAPRPQFAAEILQDFPVTIGFGIDETGRAIDIRALEGGYVEGKFEISFEPERGTLKLSADNFLKSLTIRDLMPSLRASRFAAQSPQTGCRITYTPEYVEADELTLVELARIGAAPGFRFSPSQLDRLGGSNCNAVGWPAFLLRAYPDWRKIPGVRGARKWSLTSFDIEADGAPANVAVIASSGHDDLDEEARRAVSRSRFAGGPRTGCVAPWWRNPDVIPAPPARETESFPGYQDCRAQRRWAVAPKLTFPQPYNDRAIEGWAVLGFDVGSDGAIRNVAVLSAQPSEEFGAAGEAVLLSARFEPAKEAQTRCIERITFSLDRNKRDMDTES